MKITITRGLDLSLQGAPKDSGFYKKIDPSDVSVDLRPYAPLALKLMVAEGDVVGAGSPIAEYKNFPGVFITSSVSGTVAKIRRGEKRSLLDVLIKKNPGSTSTEYSYDLSQLNQDDLLKIFKKEGLFALFKQRPFDIPALPTRLPRDVFINLADNRPFVPSAEKQIGIFSSKEEGFYVFVVGVRAIAKLFGIRPQVITTDRLTLPTKDLESICNLHIIKGPYPSGSPSTHIHYVAPIRHEKDVVFTITFQEVLAIGHLFLKGRILNQQVVALAGSGLPKNLRRYVTTVKGAAFSNLIPLEDFSSEETVFISGDPLTGRLCAQDDFPCLGMRDSTISVLSKPKQRQLFSFLRLGLNQTTVTKTYLSGFFKKKRTYMNPKSTLHGEARPIIDTEIYDKVMAMNVPVVPLIKALITKNFELATSLGFLEICGEDFALPTFIDPSKTEMLKIVRESLINYSKDSGIVSSQNT
ncbi:ubiquinone oxidoreductase, Na(+)-translocating, A subunit [Chlamydia ibidis]|uniref:Na(+)-translocating NADH-quinone reductase subunit A n=2 Tax=Chlamydia ibidis TaxID=1405396 RepID=S7J3C4_9CHLA|nr:Na(+)-translocating NADH-quinone reductase subunit A [Chlamydia ibidis]EPP34703.1 ubiquinone oxidoreductase, Na(+)-translocating, A subunit [Chlamydia ibidis]EQM62951.1 ubiquinone oxidoreductase, Na(+)-translocating, A subunit [Chlamydia ibidis 10-1398/6]